MTGQAVLELNQMHPCHGQTVEIVRRDPFKRFVIVRLLADVNRDYQKGEELRFQPDQVKSF